MARVYPLLSLVSPVKFNPPDGVATRHKHISVTFSFQCLSNPKAQYRTMQVVTRKRAWGLLLGLTTAPLLAGCSQDSGQTVVVTGSSTLAPVMADIARDFENRDPNIRVNIQSGGSSRGIADTERGTADIGMVSRDLRDSESHLNPHTIARDGVAMIVHADNPLDSLSPETIGRLYRGRIDNWSAIADYDEPVTVIHKSAGRATLEVFLRFMELDNSEIEPDMIIGENQQAIQSVAGNPGALGYVSVGAAEHEAGRGVSIRPVAIDGVEPTPESVASGDFPLARNLNLVTKDEPGEATRRVLDYALSRAAHKRIREHFFSPVTDPES